MNKLSITEKIIGDYVEQYLECSKKIDYTELTEKEGLVKVLYKDLPNTEIKGYPIASDFVAPNGTGYSVEDFGKLSEEEQKACELRFYYLPYYHELYVGTTGSGKTTGCVEPQLRAISSQKNKPNLFLTDPKGELFDRNAQHLKDNGYQLFVLNFKDLMRSDRWNPLLELYDTKMKFLAVGKGRKVLKNPVSAEYELMGSREDFSDDYYIAYDGKAFPNLETYELYLLYERDSLDAQIDSTLNQLVNVVIQVQSNTDKSWEYGAQDLLKGLIHCMLEEAIDPSSGFTRDMMTFYTLKRYYNILRRDCVDANERRKVPLESHWLMKNKSEKTLALMKIAMGNAPNTMRSYCGVFDGALKDWFQAHIFALTTGNTVNLSNFDKPFAIFLITRDYEKSDFLIAGLFIDWVYRQMLEKAEKNKNIRALHFLLDEFANIPPIKDLENKIATSRSRNIWFHLVVQSYSQINAVYNEKQALIIRNNCNAQIFLGAQDMDSKQIFANECGKHNISSLKSKLNKEEPALCEVPLIPVSMLDLIKPGQIYTKRLYMPVITSQFIRSYICAKQGAFRDFTDANGLLKCTPFIIDPFSGDKYNFTKLNNKKKAYFDDVDF